MRSDNVPDDDFDLDEILGDSNAEAFQHAEERTGPPLAYVAEKARHAIEQIHIAHGSINALVPDDFPQPEELLAYARRKYYFR
jgi:hypothetical protein